MELNQQQQKIYNKIQKFCINDKKKMLVVGPSGSGKTTVITNALADFLDTQSNYKICFCAFTNKATKVLKDMIVRRLSKDNIANMEFSTIHSLLKLEPNTIDSSIIKSKRLLERLKEEKYKKIYDWENLKELLPNTSNTSDTNYEDDILMFDYNFKKLEDLEFDILVIDECSTVSRELYVYLESTIRYLQDKNHNTKIIFLGDYYQLPPVKEYKSIVFEMATKKKWPLFKLTKVMRSKSTQVDKVNKQFLEFILRKVKTKKLNIISISTPYKILDPVDLSDEDSTYINNQTIFFKKYAEISTEDKIIITYTNGNCDKTNVSIQNLIDKKLNVIRDPDPEYSASYQKVSTMIWFKEKDRLVIQSPIEVPTYIIKTIEGKETYCVSFTNKDTNGDAEKVYNGDIFIVKKQKRINVRTVLNSSDQSSSTGKTKMRTSFQGQILTLAGIENLSSDKAITDIEKTIELIHVDTLEIEKTRRNIRKNMRYRDYADILNLFRKNFTVFKRGYCVTCYKAQGSEFKHVFVNLKSFWYCLLLSDASKKRDIKSNNARMLFSAFYTAATRSSNRLYLYW